MVRTPSLEGIQISGQVQDEGAHNKSSSSVLFKEQKKLLGRPAAFVFEPPPSSVLDLPNDDGMDQQTGLFDFQDTVVIRKVRRVAESCEMSGTSARAAPSCCLSLIHISEPTRPY